MTIRGALRRGRRRLKGCVRREDGASAVEFAMCAPVLVFACLMMLDIGLALHERMALDHVLRAGAQTAMSDPGAEEVESVLETTAKNNFTMQSTDPQTNIVTAGVTVDASRYCACPNNPTASVDCSTICAGTVPTSRFYRMSAGKVYNGMILPAITFNESMDVQIR